MGPKGSQGASIGWRVERLADPITGISPVVASMWPVTLSETKVQTFSYFPFGTIDEVEAVLVTETNYINLIFPLEFISAFALIV
jgi:hypothetical protein